MSEWEDDTNYTRTENLFKLTETCELHWLLLVQRALSTMPLASAVASMFRLLKHATVQVGRS